MCHKTPSQDSFQNGKELLLTLRKNDNGTYTECDRQCRLKVSSEPSSSAEQERAYFSEICNNLFFRNEYFVEVSFNMSL